MTRFWRPALTRAIGFLALYLTTAAALHEVGAFRYAVLWLPTGVAVSGLWLLGRGYWPVVALGTIAHRLLLGYDFPMSLPAAAGNALEAVTAVSILRACRFSAEFGRLRDGLAILLAALVAPVVSAAIGRTTSFVAVDAAHYFAGLPAWWRMNALGILVLTPLLLSWTSIRWHLPRARTLLELGVLGAVSAAVIWTLLSFDPVRADAGMVLSYLALPVALYAAIRFGVRGASLATAITVVLLTLGTIHGVGPFVEPATSSAPAPIRQVVLQAVFAIIAVTSLLIGAAITESRQAIAATRRERERREDLIASINRNINEGLFRLAPGRGFVFVNTALARMLGFESALDLAGESPDRFVADPKLAAACRKRIAEGVPMSNEELKLKRVDGTTFTGLVSCADIRDPSGTLQFMDGAVADISARRQLEDRLREAQKLEALGKLAGGIAHDFNNLLTAITGYAETLKRSLPSGSQALDDAMEISQAAHRAAGLTGQLLAYSRRQVLDPRIVDLSAVVTRMGGLLRRVIGEDIELRVRCEETPLPVRIDPGQLEQVILNLALNARDAMPAGGVLSLETSRVDLAGARPREKALHARLDVRDTGHGMSEEVRAQAFDPFFTTKGLGKGTGLGLSTVFGIVRQSEGITLLDSAPGHGTTASVCLPLVHAPVEPEAPTGRVAPLSNASPASSTVLVVEDDLLVRQLITRALADAGYVVLEATDGAHALEVIRGRATGPDLVVSDLVMPRMGGVEMVKALAAERPEIPVLLVSGYTDQPIGDMGGLTERVHYLQKPFPPSALLARVRDLLGQRGAPERADPVVS